MSKKVQARLGPQPWLRWPATRLVLDALSVDGGGARFVGGAVRDALLGRPVKDIDIATPLKPDEVTTRLEAKGVKVIPTGIKHGTVTAVAEHQHFEVTTLRHDVETYGRHAKVTFTADWQGDAARRDFTMNALYADSEGRIFDYFGGVADAKAGRVRFIGDPEARIAEDALRVLRFFRFHASYGRGTPDPAGLGACIARRMSMKGLSRERVRDELMKLLAAADPVPTFTLMLDHGILEGVVPEERNIAALATLVAVERANTLADPLRRAVSLLPRDPDSVGAVMRRLKFSNKEIKRAVAMVEPGLRVDTALPPKAARAALYRLGPQGFVDRLLLGADANMRLQPLIDLAQHWQKPEFPVTGRDLLKHGLAQGPEVGAVLRDLEYAWIASDFALDRAQLLATASQTTA